MPCGGICQVRSRLQQVLSPDAPVVFHEDRRAHDMIGPCQAARAPLFGVWQVLLGVEGDEWSMSGAAGSFDRRSVRSMGSGADNVPISDSFWLFLSLPFTWSSKCKDPRILCSKAISVSRHVKKQIIFFPATHIH